jgi:hypothetical protein
VAEPRLLGHERLELARPRRGRGDVPRLVPQQVELSLTIALTFPEVVEVGARGPEVAVRLRERVHAFEVRGSRVPVDERDLRRRRQ